MSGATATLAEFVSETRASAIPSDVLGRAKALILDNAAVALVGVQQPMYRYVSAAVRAATGSGGAMVVGTGTTAALSAAVLLNGVAIGDFEFEHFGSNAHPAASAFPTALALTAQLGRSGRDMLTAMVLGYEVAARVGRASTMRVESERGFHNPGINGTLAAAATASWLLGLDSDHTASALGIAGSSSAGLMAFSSTGAMTKRLHPGRSGQLGLEAALLAQAGVTGPGDVLENPAGFLRAFSPAAEPEQLVDGLGSTWIGSEMLIKLAPVHGHAQHFAYAINEYFAAKPRPAPGAIRSVRVVAGTPANQARHRQAEPRSLVEAQYSVVFCIAASLARSLAEQPLAFDDELVSDQTVVELARRIVLEEDSSPRHGGRITLDIDGEIVTIDAVGYPQPHEAGDLWELVLAKFRRATASLISVERQEAIIAAVRGLDAAGSLDQLVAALAPALH